MCVCVCVCVCVYVCVCVCVCVFDFLFGLCAFVCMFLFLSLTFVLSFERSKCAVVLVSSQAFSYDGESQTIHARDKSKEKLMGFVADKGLAFSDVKTVNLMYNCNGTELCGVVWCGTVWCGVVCGVVWCGVCLWRTRAWPSPTSRPST